MRGRAWPSGARPQCRSACRRAAGREHSPDARERPAVAVRKTARVGPEPVRQADPGDACRLRAAPATGRTCSRAATATSSRPRVCPAERSAAARSTAAATTTTVAPAADPAASDPSASASADASADASAAASAAAPDTSAAAPAIIQAAPKPAKTTPPATAAKKAPATTAAKPKVTTPPTTAKAKTTPPTTAKPKAPPTTAPAPKPAPPPAPAPITAPPNTYTPAQVESIIRQVWPDDLENQALRHRPAGVAPHPDVAQLLLLRPVRHLLRSRQAAAEQHRGHAARSSCSTRGSTPERRLAIYQVAGWDPWKL